MAAPKKNQVVSEETKKSIIQLQGAQDILARVGGVEKTVKGKIVSECIQNMRDGIVTEDEEGKLEAFGTYILIQEDVNEETGEISEQEMCTVALKVDSRALLSEEETLVKKTIPNNKDLFDEVSVPDSISDRDELIKFIAVSCLDPVKLLKDITVSAAGEITLTPANAKGGIPGVKYKTKMVPKKGFIEVLSGAIKKGLDAKPVEQWLSKYERVTGALKFPKPKNP